ncbi:DoxX-like family protein [Pseudomonas typographi]|uniref:DoxX family protein n=1 Tax=Pseudomonas typographi TaxID=2715964 RepID=A0ABR7Z8E3_9PSED|nr:DoxX-like family protein [Pseudomonas typographi]MBD1550738.1 DoxX family protein [Pseudomonas typographi]MBD1588669.1 DoxX family protein [Pseudomonas typographi]MBD1601638.1 DoxX family protein [Pseudomonas typographi]
MFALSPVLRIHWVARASLAFMFGFHGLVPKLLWLSQGEQAMLRAHGIEQIALFAHLAGAAEIAFALWLLLARRSGLPLIIAATALLGLLVDVAFFSPSMLKEAFNPVTLNVAGMALCAVAWYSRPEANPLSKAST